MAELFHNLTELFSITDILDIIIVAFIIYKLLGFIRETRAEQLAKGLLLLVVATVLSEMLQLYTLHWILEGAMTVGLIAIVVLFQPELRRLLENLGRSKITKVFGGIDKEEATKMVGEIVTAVENMSSKKTGALIVIEKETALNDIVESGTIVDGAISVELIENIFYLGSPLHDGATILRGTRLYASGCVLPLTQNKSLSKDMGTRHRAGLGMSENSDAFVIIVSEETGIISIAQNGRLTRFLDGKTLEKELYHLYLEDNEESIGEKAVRAIKKGVQNAKK